MCNSTLFLCVLEPFERNNVARAVHEKIKFEIIKAQFAEVQASPRNCVAFIIFSLPRSQCGSAVIYS